MRLRRGNQSLEFALAFPILLGIFAGATDYGYYFLQHSELVHVVDEATRLAADASENHEAVARQQVLDALERSSISGLQPTIETEVTGTVPHQVITLRVSAPYSSLLGLMPTPDTLSFTLSARLNYQS